MKATPNMPSTSLSAAVIAQLRRDLLLTVRHRGKLLQPLIFFILSASLFAFAVSPTPAFLEKISAAVIWVNALLATLLAADDMFRQDYRDGVLEQILLSPHPPTILILTKTLAHWLVTGVPLLAIAPLLGIMLNLPMQVLPVVMFSLLLGTPAMSLLCALGVALTLTLRRGGALMALLVFPLQIPILIFGAGAVRSALSAGDPSGQLLWLGAILLLLLALAPLAIVAALFISLD